MTDEELYELVRENYLKYNKEYLEEQLRICNEEIQKLKRNEKLNNYDK